MRHSNTYYLLPLLLWNRSVASFAPAVVSGTSTRARPAVAPERRRRSLCAAAKPKRGAAVESYQTVSVNCSTCQERLFRYKKKNGTKSNLIKCYVERIVEDSQGVFLQQQPKNEGDEDKNVPLSSSAIIEYECPSCHTRFARSATIKGLPALKLVGGKTRMTKK